MLAQGVFFINDASPPFLGFVLPKNSPDAAHRAFRWLSGWFSTIRFRNWGTKNAGDFLRRWTKEERASLGTTDSMKYSKRLVFDIIEWRLN